MKGTRLLLCVAALVLGVSLASAQGLVTVYENDFETPVGPEWSSYLRETTPWGLRTFLGRFSGEPVSLDLVSLPDHCTVTVSFELFIIDSWEGSVGYYAGADLWDLNAATPSTACPVENLLHATFANCECRYQSYPNTYPDVHHPGYTGADEVDTLGYEDDSVYYLSFTFYHDQPDLQLTFAGSANLQGRNDESWGIDNIVVQMDTSGRYCCRAERELPDGFGVGVPVPVEIEVAPNPRSEVHLIQEAPPAAWVVADINDGGVWEAETGTIKWGPFFDTTGRTLTYTAQPGPNANDTRSFVGTMYIDGESEPICGDQSISPGSFHPADLDTDWRIEAVEFTSYGAAWRNGDPWPYGPVPIPADFVTVAGLIWKAGELYHYDATATPPWVADSGKTAGGGAVVADLGAVSYRSGHGVPVRLSVTPDLGTLAYLVADAPPLGWSVTDIANGGRWDAATGTVKWGPYFDAQPQSFTYRAVPPADETDTVVFLGSASFNGIDAAIAGERTIGPNGDRVDQAPLAE